MREAVLSIYYTDKYKKLHVEPQGKFFYLAGKPVFLADMNDHKWWRNYGGYSIAKQLLEAFSKLKLRVQILYRLKDKGLLYITTPSVFKKKGILISCGSHEQYVLPISNWDAKQLTVDDPHNLPVIRLSDWIKTKNYIEPKYKFVDGVAIPIEEPKQEALLA